MINDILENGRQVTLTMQVPVTVDNGLPSQEEINKHSEKLFKFVTDYLKRDFITIDKGFPNNGKANVNISVDFVVIDGEEFRKLKREVERYGY